MNNERNNTTAGGIGFCGLLAVAFIVLKLTGVIAVGILLICLVVVLCCELLKGARK